MATKSERFRYDVERSSAAHPKPRKQAAVPRRPSKGKKAVYELEVTGPHVTPSRKSTRKSKHRQKAATALTGKKTLERNNPRSQHERGRPSTRAAH
jgi:hypothetical protein